MRYIKFFIFLFLSCGSALSSAEAMRGVQNIAILIENLSDDTVKCNVSKDMLDAAVRIPLSNSKLRVTNVSNTMSYLYVKVALLQINNSCAGSILLSFNKYSKSENDTGEFWNKSMIIYDNKNSISKSISDDVESFAKEFIAAWLKANPN
jgi:hypothetical protein